jgi:uncharacterized protein
MSADAPGFAPISDAEIDHLAEQLAAIKTENALDLEGVDGLFCALVASPANVPPSTYLPVILGGETGTSAAFANLDEANRTISLIMRYWNSIIADLERESIHMPFITEPGVDGIQGRAWAQGFMRGVRLAPTGWNELLTDENEGLLVSIPLVAGEMDPEWPKQPLTREKNDELVQWMIAGAARAYTKFAAVRRKQAEEMYADALDDEDDNYPETYVRPERKVGRNEPCPCGSGRKYKRCCGTSGTPLTH